MATIIKKINLVKADPVKNNNKFWRGTAYSDGSVLCEWGRIGDKGQSKLFPSGGESFLMKKVREKTSDGRNDEIAYREIDIIDNDVIVSPSVKSVASPDLKQIAMKQIKTSSKNKEVMDLIEYMTKVNIHNITSFSGNNIKYNYDKGMFQTEMGLIGQSTIDSARNVLVEIGDLVASRNYGNELLEKTRDYCMKVPQNLGHKRLEVKEFWSDIGKVQQQNSVLDGLQASLVQAISSPKDKAIVTPEEQVFNVHLDVVSDNSITKEIFDYYYNTRSTMHQCYSYKPKKIWKVEIKGAKDSFDKDGGKMRLVIPGFHGSGSSNLLSLLKSGILVRPPSSAHVSGALFGSGAYMAPLKRENGDLINGAASKALNYSTNFWGGNNSQRTFMFFVKMGMNKYYVPEARNYDRISYPVSGYDSTWAYGGHSGVRNDEAICYRSSQINIEYLIEFDR